ncbi:Uncharacterized protein PPKH_3169 [Pseudomonas putida]|nr:Uncharacterized protein PPKH_3169 [Pseudomonas putida]
MLIGRQGTAARLLLWQQPGVENSNSSEWNIQILINTFLI